MRDFILQNKPEWDELEALVKRARRGIRLMKPEELTRLDVLYRRVTIQLSQVATRTTDAGLIRYLNALTAAAHSVIYVSPRVPFWKGAIQFVTTGFARVVARNWRFHATSAFLVIAGGVIGYFASRSDVLAAYALWMAGDQRQPGSTAEQLLKHLRSGREQGDGSKFLFASLLFQHNLKVSVLAMATGALAAVPTVILMVYNGMILGAFTAIHAQRGIYAEYWAWILPHGITELGAVALCGGVGLRIGHAVLKPGLQTRGEALKDAGMDAVQTCVGVGIMLVFAAIIESYLRQSYLPTSERLIFAAVSAVFWLAYFGRGAVLERAARTKSLDLAQ